MTSRAQIIRLESSIRRRFRWHLRELGFKRQGYGSIEPSPGGKEGLRALHRKARAHALLREREFISEAYPRLRHNFASGKDVIPSRVRARFELVGAGTEGSDLFRLAGLTWGVPVTPGYGRRIRFLVRDESNGKLIGLIGLSDPVFNLTTRDVAIGWSGEDRVHRLVDVMNAHVLGAVPPYNLLLGGKLVACLVRSKEVRDVFRARYAESRGLISGERKRASLVLVTVTSSLGKSSVYDRLRLGDTQYFESIGFTSGWGHFHVPERLFHDIQKLLRIRHHDYAHGNRFGDGANWRLRATREALEMLGMDPNLLRHNIRREVFLCRLARNANQILNGTVSRPDYTGLLTVPEVCDLAVERWVLRRAQTRPEFQRWKSEYVLRLLDPKDPGLASLSLARPSMPAVAASKVRNLEQRRPGPSFVSPFGAAVVPPPIQASVMSHPLLSRPNAGSEPAPIRRLPRRAFVDDDTG